jgi:hypothetical protein
MCRVSPEVALEEVQKHKTTTVDYDEETPACRNVGVSYENSLSGEGHQFKH